MVTDRVFDVSVQFVEGYKAVGESLLYFKPWIGIAIETSLYQSFVIHQQHKDSRYHPSLVSK